MRILVILILIPFYLFSQNENDFCEDLEKGTFELYKKGEKIGFIYRKNEYQIEEYLNEEGYTIAKIKQNECLFRIKAHIIEDELDTITWAVSYQNIGEDKYSFEGKPAYLDIDYVYKGSIVKLGDVVNEKILIIFANLERDSKGSK
jgi:hypothetical protein